MTIRNCSTNVSFGPRRYSAPGSNGETYDVIHWHDDTWTCTCAHFCKRIKNPVADLKYGCKHMRRAADGELGKPHVRCSHRTIQPKPRRAPVSDETREHVTMLDVG